MREGFNFFVFEGLDGSGKTSVINLLKKDFPGFVYTREPGGSAFGEAMRGVLLSEVAKNTPPLAMLLGFMSGRSSHLEELVIPALKEGKTVLSDRCDGSSFAFQLYGQNNLNLTDLFWNLRNQVFGELKVHYIYLRITPEVANKRRKERLESNHFDTQTESYHERVFQGYEKFFRILGSSEQSQHQSSVVDASASLETVYQNVLRIIQNRA